MPYAIYDPLTGDILRIANYPANHPGPWGRPGEAVVEVGPEVNDATHRIEDGVPVPL